MTQRVISEYKPFYLVGVIIDTQCLLLTFAGLHIICNQLISTAAVFCWGAWNAGFLKCMLKVLFWINYYFNSDQLSTFSIYQLEVVWDNHGMEGSSRQRLRNGPTKLLGLDKVCELQTLASLYNIGVSDRTVKTSVPRSIILDTA